jgi:beta-lactamase regulating signal transducer with metallopeptidase domain
MSFIDLVVRALGWTLIHSLWMGTLVGVIYLLAAGAWRSSRPQRLESIGLCLLGMLALGLLAVLLRGLAGPSVTPAEIAAAMALLPEPGVVLASASPLVATGSVGAKVEAILPFVVGAWSLVVLLLGARLWQTQRALKRLVQASTPLESLAPVVVELAASLGIRRGVRVLASATARVPFIIGHLAPVIVLPLAVAHGLPWPQLRLILLHELAHLKRADYLVNGFQVAIEIVLFFHPVVRWMSADLRRVREECCDDLVLGSGGDRTLYVRALLGLEEYRAAALSMASAASGGALLWRVRRIAGARERQQTPWRQALWALAATLATAVLLVAAGQGGARGELARPAAPAVDWGSALSRLPTSVPDWRALPLPAPALPQVTQEPEGERPASASTQAPASAVQPLTPPALLPPTAARLSTATAAPESAPVATPPVSAPQSTTTQDNAPAPVPLLRRAPAYPRSEKSRPREVVLEMSYRIDADGRVVDMLVESAPPVGAHAFISAAKDALRDWRYDPADPALDSQARLQQRFMFRVGDEDSVERCVMVTGSRICRS